MNKAELVEYVAKEAELSKADAERALNAMIKGIKVALKKSLQVILIGFGTFKVSQRAARMGRNPRSGAPMKIAARRIVSFRAGKALKDEVK